MSTADKPSYGFDAPEFMRNALLGGSLAVMAGQALLSHWGGLGTAVGLMLLVGGLLTLLPGLCLIAYGLRGKFRVRDRMLDMVPWRGNETVLDVGTGRGLLLVGAAKRLTTGKVVGIDIWRAGDLSGNARENTLRNASIEGVENRVEVLDSDIRRTSLPDGSFDVVLSLLCLHNIDDSGERLNACREIARVLKPGGRVVVGDYIPTGGYAKAFATAGLKVESSRSHIVDALGLMWIVSAQKNLSSLNPDGNAMY